MRAAPFRFDAIKAAVASDVEDTLPRQIGRQTLLDHFPGFARMIDRLAHHAFGLREDSIAEIDPVKPGLKNFQTDQDFVTPHTNQRVLRIVAAACSAPETSIMIKLSR